MGGIDMNFGSQICTTREQSERLLALGLKKETADMKYLGTREYYGGILTEGTSSLPIIIDTEDDDITEYDTPAWSLNRLIEMMPRTAIMHTQEGDTRIDIDIYAIEILVSEDPIAEAVSVIEWLIKEGNFNKKYLV